MTVLGVRSINHFLFPKGTMVASTILGLTDEVTVPVNINQGLICPTPQFLTSLLGVPRDKMTSSCQPITNKELVGHILTAQVGPFSVTGLRWAVDDLKQIFFDIKLKYPDIYAKLGSAGMLCCRLQRGSATLISSHSWGTAIDLTLDKKLDTRGNRKVFHGLTLIAPIFNRYGWYWGATFRVEDSMHFEVSTSKLNQWKGLLGKPEVSVGSTKRVLKQGDKGVEIRVLQARLNRQGARLIVDGDFGKTTLEAVLNFQKKSGLKPDGIVGVNTRKALGM